MRPRDRERGQQLHDALIEFDQRVHPLAGINAAANRDALVEQLLESIHRVEYVRRILDRDVSPRRADPADPIFDPLKAAILHARAGDTDEAFWLVFLSVHFGKPSRGGWGLIREVYGQLGGRDRWSWHQTAANPQAFRRWLTQNHRRIRGRFGNHRKYSSLDPGAQTGNTADTFESYIRWVKPPRTHRMMIDDCRLRLANDGHAVFDELYNSLDAVTNFGRMAKFDYLTMLGKLKLAPIEPGSIYMAGATGPLTGARLLFAGEKTARLSSSSLERLCIQLGAHLGVGMQVIEDAVCNWQKSPSRFVAFRG